MEQDWLEIQKMSSEIGMQSILKAVDEKEDENPGFSRLLDNMVSYNELTLWFFLNCPEDWEKALWFCRIEKRAKHIDRKKLPKERPTKRRYHTETYQKQSLWSVIGWFYFPLIENGINCNIYAYQWSSGDSFLVFFEKTGIGHQPDVLTLEVIVRKIDLNKTPDYFLEQSNAGAIDHHAVSYRNKLNKYNVLLDALPEATNNWEQFPYPIYGNGIQTQILARKVECNLDELHDLVHMRSKKDGELFKRVFEISGELNKFNTKLRANPKDNQTSSHGRQSLASAEHRCGEWLTSFPEKPGPKKDIKAKALKKFPGLSGRGFDRAWTIHTPKAWQERGRPKNKTPHQ